MTATKKVQSFLDWVAGGWLTRLSYLLYLASSGLAIGAILSGG
jgi:hypothetical protein